MEDFKDPEIARNWSSNPLARNPARAEQLDILFSIVADHYRPGEIILDVGIGSGLVEEQLFERLPEAYVVGVDYSDAMARLAHERLTPFAGRYEIVHHDLRRTASLRLPAKKYSVAVSVQTVHNIEDDYKREVFAFVHGALESGGLFLLLDRVAAEPVALFDVYRSVWRRLNRVHDARMREGDTYEEYLARLAEKGDMPISLEQHLRWLREVGFEAACLHLHANRALFAARKP